MVENEKITVESLKKMSDSDLILRAKKISKRFCVGDGQKFKLKNYSTQPKMIFGPDDKPLVKEALAQGIDILSLSLIHISEPTRPY